MTNPDQTGTDNGDGELSPEARAMLGKARRSFGISIGILLVGFMAIGAALVYRVTRDAPAAEMVAQISLPAGAEVVSALINGGQVNVTYRLGGATTLSLFDAETGELSSSLLITTD
jgi:hypothetical protein